MNDILLVYQGQQIQGFAPHRIASCGIARTFQNLRLFGNLYQFSLAELQILG